MSPSFSRSRRIVAALVAASSVATAGAADASIDFRGDFESGSTQPWTGLQYEFDRARSESFVIVQDPVRQGRYAAKFVAQQGYSPFGWGESTQLEWDSGERDGQDYWYAWSTLFPRDWTSPFGWGIFAEWHSSFSIPPPIALNAVDDAISLNIHTGLVSGAQWAYNRNVTVLATLPRGTWTDFVVRVKWAASDAGTIEVWTRGAAESQFTQRVAVTQIPTLQWDAAGPSRIYTLFGLYRNSYCGPNRTDVFPGCVGTTLPGTQATNVLYQDGFVRGTSFKDVVAAAFPDARVKGGGKRPRMPAARLSSRAV